MKTLKQSMLKLLHPYPRITAIPFDKLDFPYGISSQFLFFSYAEVCGICIFNTFSKISCERNIEELGRAKFLL